MKYLTVFDEHTQYNSYMVNNKLFPNVSYCLEHKNVHYKIWDGLETNLKHAHIQEPVKIRYDYPYNGTIVCDEGYEVYECSIMMGEDDITSTAWNEETNSIHIDNVTDKVKVSCYIMHSMPDNYIKVEGVKNINNSYIDTGYKISSKNIISVDFEKITGYVFGSKATGNTTAVGTVLRIYEDGRIMHDINKSGVIELTGSTTSRNTVVFDNYKGKVYLNNVLKRSANKGTDVDGRNLWVFKQPVTGDSINSTGMIIYSFKIFDALEDSYIRYFIPCLNENNVAGFWDAARGVFQGSSNSTAFEGVAADGGTFRLINFEDSAVKNICVTNWGGHYKAGEMYTPEARIVTTLSNKFENNANIVKFNELQYFTGLTTLSRVVSGQNIDGMPYYGAFNRCSNLEEITLPNITISGQYCIAALFLRCGKLKTVDMSPITVSGSTSLYNLCRLCTAVTNVILPHVTVITTYLGFMYAFNTCSNLVTIDASNTNFTYLNYTNNPSCFGGCSKLTRIIGGLSEWKQTVTISACPLTHDAAVELLTSLGTVTEARTITLKTSVYNSLTTEEKAIATDKGWTLAYE